MPCRNHAVKGCPQLRVPQVAAGEIKLGATKADVLPVTFKRGARLVNRPLGRRTGVLSLNALLAIVSGLFFFLLGLGSRQ